MSARLSSAGKAHIEALALGLPVFTEFVPTPRPPRYIRVLDNISTTRDGNSKVSQRRATEQLQVEVIEELRDLNSNERSESPTLAKLVEDSFECAELPTAPQHVYRTLVFSSLRTQDESQNLVRTIITINVRRRTSN